MGDLLRIDEAAVARSRARHPASFSILPTARRVGDGLAPVEDCFSAMAAAGCESITLRLVRPGRRTHALWRVAWIDAGGASRWAEGSSAATAVRRAERSSTGRIRPNQGDV